MTGLVYALKLHTLLSGKIITPLTLFSVFFLLPEIYSQNLYSVSKIQSIEINTDATDWPAILQALKLEESEKTIPAELILNKEAMGDIGFRYKGNSSFYYRNKKGGSKLPFHIDIKNNETEEELSVKNILLNNIFRDPSYIREILAYEIIREYMPAPLINFSELTINGDYLGLYHNVEFIDAHFLNNHFGESSGVFFKCDPNYKRKKTKKCPYGPLADLTYRGSDSLCYYSSYEKKSDHGWRALIQLTDILNNHIEGIENILDVDQALTFIALNNIMVNLDSYTGKLCHNYYLYQDSTGIFNPIIWDLNLAFGGFDLIGDRALSKNQLITLSPFIHENNDQYPLISKLLSIKKYKVRYIKIYSKILEEQFLSERYLDNIFKFQNIIAESIKKAKSNSTWPSNINNSVEIDDKVIIGIKELMQARIDYLRIQFNI